MSMWVRELELRSREVREVSWEKTPFGKEVSLLLLRERFLRLILL